jgi:hydrogenase maturation protease
MGVRTTVIGIGNLLFTDDGVGVHAINALRERFAFPEEVSLIDGGTTGLELLPAIEEADQLILIDAVDFRKEPGTIQIIEGGDVKKFMDLKFSVHQIGIPDMLFAAEFKGILPKEMCLIGIQPQILEASTSMSEPVKKVFEDLIKVTIERLSQIGVEAKELAPEDRNKPTVEYGNVSRNTI